MGESSKTTSYFYHELVPVNMPVDTIGQCKKCKVISNFLGDDLCVTCFDSTVTNRMDRHNH